MTDTTELIARADNAIKWCEAENDHVPIGLMYEMRMALAAQAQEIERAHESNRKLAQRNVWFTEAMQACQKLLCLDFGNCEPEKDGEKCACGFEGGSFANAIPKNRRADAAEARVRECEARIERCAQVADRIDSVNGIGDVIRALLQSTP